MLFSTFSVKLQCLSLKKKLHISPSSDSNTAIHGLCFKHFVGLKTVRDQATYKNKEYAFVTFHTPELLDISKLIGTKHDINEISVKVSRGFHKVTKFNVKSQNVARKANETKRVGQVVNIEEYIDIKNPTKFKFHSDSDNVKSNDNNKNVPFTVSRIDESNTNIWLLIMQS